MSEPRPLRVLIHGATASAAAHVTAVLDDLHARQGIALLLAPYGLPCDPLLDWGRRHGIVVTVFMGWTGADRPDLAIVFAGAPDESEVIRRAQKAGVPVLLVPMAGEVP